LESEGILVRCYDTPLLRDYVRISIGRQRDSDALISALRGLGGLLDTVRAEVTLIPPTSSQATVPDTRQAALVRQTRETRVEVRLDLDGAGSHQIDTGLPFLDHMLAQIAVHGLFDLQVQARGDVEIDPHHTMEDVALALGSAFHQALRERAGIVRIASADCPMDESLAWTAVDFSGRPYSVIQVEWHGPEVGGLPVSLIPHFLESFATQAKCNVHVNVRYGFDDHHQAEAIFKSFARALCAATRVDPRRFGRIPSSKGVLS
jgi:imidazoleglycerol-phosphate dehydratase